MLSVGFLELSDDLSTRLPVFMDTYDAVVVGDGDFHFIRQTVQDVLGLDTGGMGLALGLGAKDNAKKLFEGFGRAFGVGGQQGAGAGAGAGAGEGVPSSPGAGGAAAGHSISTGSHGFVAGTSMGDLF